MLLYILHRSYRSAVYSYNLTIPKQKRILMNLTIQGPLTLNPFSVRNHTSPAAEENLLSIRRKLMLPSVYHTGTGADRFLLQSKDQTSLSRMLFGSIQVNQLLIRWTFFIHKHVLRRTRARSGLSESAYCTEHCCGLSWFILFAGNGSAHPLNS